MARSRYFLLAASAVAICISNPAFADGIKMLPPTACPNSGALGVLGWDGANPLSCANGITSDNTGNLTLTGQLRASSVNTGSFPPGSSSGNGAVQVNGNFFARNADAKYESIDQVTGRTYELIGTYHGWDPNSIYIGGYNASSGSNARSVSFGGLAGAGPTTYVDLVNRKVGIKTLTPQATLDVRGEVRVSSTAVACGAANEGAMRYNSASHKMEFCNGTVWGTMGGGAIACIPGPDGWIHTFGNIGGCEDDLHLKCSGGVAIKAVYGCSYTGPGM